MARNPSITVNITGDTQGLSKATGQATADLEGFGSRVSGFAVGAGAAVTTFAINAVPQLIGLGTELFNLGQSSEIGLSKAATVFGDSNGAIRKWADDVNESLGLSDEAVTGLAAGMGDLLVPLGFSREAAAQMTQESIGAAGALSAWSQGQYDAAQVSEILTKAYLGETDGLKALGISINAAEVEARALEIAQLDGRDAVTAQDKALATQALVMEKSADAQAAWTDGTMDAVKEQNELKATVDDAKEALAARLVPAVQAVVKWITTDLIPAVRQGVDIFREYWPKIQEAVQPVLEWLSTTVQDVIEVVRSAWEQFGSRIMTYVGIVWSYVQETIANALQIVQGIFDVVLGILSGDWSRAWDGIKNVLGGVWDQITNMVRMALRAVGLIIDIAWENVKGVTSGAWDSVKSTISGGINAIVGFVTGMPGRIFGTVYSLWDGLRDSITGAKDWVKARIDDVVSFATGLPGRMGGIFSGMWDGIKSAFRSAINAVIDGWNGLQFKVPSVSAFGVTIGGQTIGTPNIPRLADGGIVSARPGGLLAMIGEGRYDEAVVPLKPGMNLGGTTTIVQNFPSGTRPSDVVKAQRDWVRRNGPLESAA